MDSKFPWPKQEKNNEFSFYMLKLTYKSSLLYMRFVPMITSEFPGLILNDYNFGRKNPLPDEFLVQIIFIFYNRLQKI